LPKISIAAWARCILTSTEVLQESLQRTGAVVMAGKEFAMAEDPDWFAGSYEYFEDIESIKMKRIKVVDLPGGRTHLRFRIVR
jgi:hypothetical protein